MRQYGSERVRSDADSHAETSGNSNDSPVSIPRTDQSIDAPSKKYSKDTDESIADVHRAASSDDAVNAVDAVDAIAARDYLRRLNERRTRSERYPLHRFSRGKRFLFS